MRRLYLKIFNIGNRFLYFLLGPKISTKVATSLFGKFVFKIIYGDSNDLKVYQASIGIKLKLYGDEALMLGLTNLGVINLYETNILNKLINAGDVFIDVGAYVDGWYTLLSAKKVGKTGHVYSFEPNPTCFRRLRQNIKLNDFSNVTAVDLALSEKKGYRDFYLSDNTSTFYKNHYKEKQNSKIRVRTMSLDDYIHEKKIPRVDFIKIDVECAEMDVLRGGKKILAKDKAPNLIVEVVDQQLKVGGSSKKELFEYLGKFGYKAFTFGKSRLEKYDAKKDNDGELNLYFTKMRR